MKGIGGGEENEAMGLHEYETEENLASEERNRLTRFLMSFSSSNEHEMGIGPLGRRILVLKMNPAT